jgi:hypothetical protein
MDMKKIGIFVVAGALTILIAMPFESFAGQKGGKMKRLGNQTQTGTVSRSQDRLRLRDGSCTSQTATASGKLQKKGNTYGPGDGTGNAGVGPQDGTGYGAPSQR